MLPPTPPFLPYFTIPLLYLFISIFTPLFCPLSILFLSSAMTQLKKIVCKAKQNVDHETKEKQTAGSKEKRKIIKHKNATAKKRNASDHEMSAIDDH